MADSTLTLKLDKDSIFNLLEGLRGPKGEKGEDGQRGERGEKGEQGLRGPKGETASATKAAQLLKEKNIYLADDSVETVVAKLVELVSDTIHVTYKPLEYVQPLVGQQFLDLKGEPHFKVSVNNGEKKVLESDNIRVEIPAFGENDILVRYYDLSDREVGSAAIKGVVVGETPNQEYRENGVLYKLFGTTLKMNVTNNTVNGNFNDNPKNWDVTHKVIYADKPTTLDLGDSFRTNINQYGPYYIETPENVSFIATNGNMSIVISTSKQSEKHMNFRYNEIKWSTTDNSYINTGYYNDAL